MGKQGEEEKTVKYGKKTWKKMPESKKAANSGQKQRENRTGKNSV